MDVVDDGLAVVTRCFYYFTQESFTAELSVDEMRSFIKSCIDFPFTALQVGLMTLFALYDRMPGLNYWLGANMKPPATLLVWPSGITGVARFFYAMSFNGAIVIDLVGAIKGEKFQYLKALRCGLLLPKLHLEFSVLVSAPSTNVFAAVFLPLFLAELLSAIYFMTSLVWFARVR